MNRLRSLITVLFLFCCTAGFAQGGPGQSAIGETMRSNGRIYVVIAVILIILAGLILYVVRLDKKMSRLEKGQ
ncbi:MAG: hypothetical protein QM781_16265 [Chitinophagaceae bacterium]